ncbi:hypothetical protein KAI52_00355 [Candidatus Parcubacteria bacterium]|nr:hypothetical protein [Candidatus Parcubacteria bacterium]
MNEDRNLKNEIIAGIILGMIVGAIIAMATFTSLNVWFLAFSPINSSLIFLTIAMVWIIFVMNSTLYYKLFRRTIYRDLSFFVGLLAIISLMNYIYNILAYDINLPYDSLKTIKIVAFVTIGTGIGLMIKIIVRLIKKETIKKTSQ